MKRTFLDHVSDKIALFSEIACGIMLTIIAISLFTNVIGRYILRQSLPWAEEVSRYLIIWVAMLVTNILIKQNELICVDFFDMYWPKKLIRYRDFTYRVLMVFMFSLLIYQGWIMALDGRIVKIASMKVSWFWPYLSVPVGCSLMLVQLLIMMFKEFYKAQKD